MTPTAAPPTDLTRLLDTERGLEERLRAARVEAEALVANARQAAAGEEATLEAELAAEARLLDERLATEGRRRSAEIADGAERETRAYEQVSAARLAAVARGIAERFLLTENAG